MHLGNLSMTVNKDGFEWLPTYDMLPMMYAPVRGEIVDNVLTLPVRPMKHADLWQSSGRTAHKFWLSVADDSRVSDEFRRTAVDNAGSIKSII